jgi:hypothetical protein
MVTQIEKPVNHVVSVKSLDILEPHLPQLDPATGQGEYESNTITLLAISDIDSGLTLIYDLEQLLGDIETGHSSPQATPQCYSESQYPVVESLEEDDFLAQAPLFALGYPKLKGRAVNELIELTAIPPKSSTEQNPFLEHFLPIGPAVSVLTDADHIR